MTKVLFSSSEYFNKMLRLYKDDDYDTYFIDKPKAFPCVGIMTQERKGEYGTLYIMDTYVYLTDFKQ